MSEYNIVKNIYIRSTNNEQFDDIILFNDNNYYYV